MSDRSLDEFAPTPPEGDEAASETADDHPDDTDTDPSVPTMRWSADGVACDACGTVVSRRWRGDDGFVCADCKEW